MLFVLLFTVLFVDLVAVLLFSPEICAVFYPLLTLSTFIVGFCHPNIGVSLLLLDYGNQSLFNLGRPLAKR